MAEPWIKEQTIDLANAAPVALEFEASLGDRLAHTWKVSMLKNGAAVSLAGATVTADFLRMGDRGTVVLVGAVSANVASVTLTQECYAVAGDVRGSMRIVVDGAIITTAHCVMRVKRDDSDVTVEPGAMIPDIEDLLAAVPAANAAAAAANDAAVYARQSRFTVLGIYATLSALQAAHPTGTPGDAYAVGTASSNVIYVWNVDTSAWASIGGIPVIDGAFKKGAEIPSGADLNNYFSPGSYMVISAGVSATIANIPLTNSGGRLEVKITTSEGTTADSSFLYQEYIPHNYPGGFVRMLIGSGGWLPWQKRISQAVGADDWLTPTLQNGWAEVSGYPVRYYKDAFGFVHCKGLLTFPASGANVTIFQFPAGYRPGVSRRFTVAHGDSATSIARFKVDAVGAVTCEPTLNTGTWADITVISFKAEA